MRNSSSTSLPDTLFDLLANDRRRRVIAFLADVGQDDWITLRDLTVELPDGDEDIGTESADTLAVSLHHDHLPKLDEAGFIEYDPKNHMVAPVTSCDNRLLTDLTIESE